MNGYLVDTLLCNTSRPGGGRVFLAGDCHGRFDHVIEAARMYLPAAIVFLGDMEAPVPLHEVLAPIMGSTSIWWIPGNHDTDSEASHDHVHGSALAGYNLHGRVVEIAGVRIARLGGVFREKVWAPPGAPLYQSAEDFTRHCRRGNRWRSGLPLKHRSTIFPDIYHQLFKQRADVLVTHEAPSYWHGDYGQAAIDGLARGLHVSKTFHGHLHADRKYGSSLGFHGYGVGLRGIMDLDGQVVVPGGSE